MKTWEALKAADEGKKIRRKWWVKGAYALKEESATGDTCLVAHFNWENGVYRLEGNDIFSSDWELYEGKDEVAHEDVGSTKRS